MIESLTARMLQHYCALMAKTSCLFPRRPEFGGMRCETIVFDLDDCASYFSLAIVTADELNDLCFLIERLFALSRGDESATPYFLISEVPTG